jgi:hypothetical protein
MHDASSRESTSVRSHWLRRSAFAIVVMVATFTLVVGVMVSALTLERSAGSWNERGVKLGMSEGEIVRAFADGRGGEWKRVVACRGVALEWTRRAGGVPSRWARFEMHEGVLVAMRVHSDDKATGVVAETGWGAVRAARPYQGGMATTVIARGCATHAAEADEIASLAR